MDVAELSRWTRFAGKGGIGKCTAIQDCVAESGEDLMFLKDDEITVLMQIPDSDGVYLGYCEGVVGRFQAHTVHFHSKLKRPIMTKRNSTAASTYIKSPAAVSPSPTLGAMHRTSSSTPISSDPATPQTPAFPATSGSKPISSPDPLLYQDRTLVSRTPSIPVEPSSIIPPVERPSSNHAHTSSLAHSEFSQHSSTMASAVDVDYGMPRTMSPPSMYEESNLHARQLSIASVLLSDSATKGTEMRSAEPESDVDQVLVPKRSGSVRSSYVSSSTRSKSPASMLNLTAVRESTLSTNYPSDGEKQESRLSMASAVSDGEVGIGLSLLASLGDGDSDDDSEDVHGGRNALAVTASSTEDNFTDSSGERRAFSPSPISEDAMAAFPRPPSTQIAVATSSDPINPFGTFGQSVASTGVRGRLDGLFENLGQGSYDAHSSIASSESLGTDSAESKETSSSESGGATAQGHSSQLAKSVQSPPPTRASVRSDSIYSSSSQNSRSIHSTSPDLPVSSPAFPLHNFKFPAQRPEPDANPSTVASSSSIPPPHSPTLSHTSGASASEWEGASDIYDNYLYRYSMASKSSRLSQMSMASRSGYNHRNVPSTSTMPPAAIGGMVGALNSPTTANFRPQNGASTGVDVATESSTERPNVEEPLNSSLSADSTDTNATITPSQIPPRYDSLTMQRAPSVIASLRSLSSRRSVGSVDSPHHSEDESDDESIYSRLSSKPSLSLLEAHAAALLAPENQGKVNTTTALNVIKNSPSPNTSSFGNIPAIPSKTTGRRPSPLDLTKDQARTSTAGNANDMIGPSPLLHTHWGSPVSSTGLSTGSMYDDGSSAGYPTPPLTEVRGSDDEKSKVLSSLKEGQREFRTADTEDNMQNALDSSTSTITRPLVIEDDEELPSHAIDPDEGELDMSLTTVETVNVQFGNDTRASVDNSHTTSKSKNESLGVLPLSITSNSSLPGDQFTPGSPLSGSSPVSAISPYSPGDLPMDLLPPAPSQFPPPSPTQSQPISRPSLAELRGYAGSAVQGQRQSLFLPHPNAPKAPLESPGPMYIRKVDSFQPSQVRQGPDPRKVASNVLRMVLEAPPPQFPSVMLPPPSSMPIRGTTKNGNAPNPPAPPPRGPTIYARVDVDLASSNGPVPITFSVEPMGPPPLPILRAQDNMNPIQPSLQQSPPSPRHPPPALSQQYQQSQSPQMLNVKRSVTASASLPSSSNMRTPSQAPFVAPQATSGSVIPRESFTSQTPKLRPRSKSFSAGITSTVKDTPSSIPSPPPLRSRGSSTSLSSTPLVPPTTPSSNSSPLRPSSLSRPASNSKLRNVFSLSPLSSMPFSNNSRTASLSGGGIKPPSSPLASGFGPTTTGVPSQLRKVTSMASLPSMSSSPSRRTSGSKAATNIGSDDSQPVSPTVRKSNDQPSSGGRDSDVMSLASSRSQAISPPLVTRRPSLQSKFSMPNLRRGRLSRDDGIGSSITENETVQVKDMDFELVRPNFPIAGSRSSEDSSSAGFGRSSESRPAEAVHLRSESPAVSVSSGISGTSRITAGVSSDSAAFRSKASSKASDSEASMDAHRQREQKWMLLISTVPAAQARKNKKVRKLLGEGVPSSVRYLVWSHLTNAKSKGVAGVYSQLSKRVRVAAFADMERDVKRCFGEHPHLQSTEGPLVSLLQAYLTMVPDVQYSTGLTLIAGHTLLLAPEEDAFWIFVSMMDSALRPYFSPHSTQMEVDAALFSRALEANDVQVSKKVLVDMSMNPAHICFSWFTTLFVGSLPGDYVNRVWDLFLFEGTSDKSFCFRLKPTGP
ncbi:hypothetical protein GYMLUDRAFT_528906 [Collybiopsis luxurians FD-317 M1]|nr:hypothetical protein GYMLUDRAFT_528906 [Collybiopsis luxurians FD-317 M1]